MSYTLLSQKLLMNIIFTEIQKKNQKVFKNFFSKNYDGLVRYANGYLFDIAASEDIVQDVFIYIWENAENINLTSSLNGYLSAMVRNKCLNFLKSLKITDDCKILEFNFQLVTEYDFDTTSESDKKIIHHQVLKIVDTLPEKMQEIVKLKFISNYKYAEIAEELNISINTVKTQLKRAKVIISKMLISVLILLDINH